MSDNYGVAGDRLKSFVERIERLREEKKSVAKDEKEVFAEAKAQGFDTKTIRQMIKVRQVNREVREERLQLLDIYMSAIGMDSGNESNTNGIDYSDIC